MPIFTYRCDNCGFEQEQFLKSDSESLPMTCKRCLRQTIARQTRDNAVEYKQNGDIVGTLRHEEIEA